MARPKKKNVDWKCIEAEWIKGVEPILELAQWYNVAESTIRLHAKTHGWPPRKRASAPPAHAETNDRPMVVAGLPAPLATVAADTRMIVGCGKDLVLRLLDELDAVTMHRGDLAAMITADTRGDDGRKRAAMMNAISLASRAQIIKALAAAAKTFADASPKGPEVIDAEALPGKEEPESWDRLLN